MLLLKGDWSMEHLWLAVEAVKGLAILGCMGIVGTVIVILFGGG